MSEAVAGPGAGWYNDPKAPGTQRYWDGSGWTDHYAPLAAAGPAPAVAVAEAKPRTSGMAVASLVLSLLWIYGIGSVLAIIFAAVAKKNIREGNGMVTGGGMATAGLVIGIIGAVIVALLILVAAGESSSGSGYYY
jgi:hypothetical protein